MQCSLLKEVTITFLVEDHRKEWIFDRVLIIPLLHTTMLGRSCTSENHPFHLHEEGSTAIVRFTSKRDVEFPFSKEISTWEKSKSTAIGEKERKKKKLEISIAPWFKKLA